MKTSRSRSFALISVFVIVLPLNARAQTPAPAQSSIAPVADRASEASQVQQQQHYNVVPFGQPGAQSSFQADATDSFVKQLTVRGFIATPTRPVTLIDVPAAAHELCATPTDDGILVGSFDYDQTQHKASMFGSLSPVFKAMEATGIGDTAPTKVHLTVSLVGCDGNVIQSVSTVGNNAHRGKNVNAAVQAAFEDAAARALDEILRDRPILQQH